jgi:Icc-related predicted phosphoesterase
MRIVALSDTHLFHKRLAIPDGDMLIHAGDFSMRAKFGDVVEFATWFKSQPHQYKLLIAGNHDCYCDTHHGWTREEFFPAIYLCHEEVTVGGYRIFGSPYSPSPGYRNNHSSWSFDYPRPGPRARELWSQIPYGLDILITHGPPKGILDLIPRDLCDPGEDPHIGDEDLAREVERACPKIHIFGHIHEGHGTMQQSKTRFYNVSVCDDRYQPNNPITIINLD